MGNFRPELVWTEIGAFDIVRKKLNQFVKKYPYWFSKSKVLTNSTINYVMFWDGSKEGWDTSNRADKIRKKFIETALKGDEYVYHIIRFDCKTKLEFFKGKRDLWKFQGLPLPPKPKGMGFRGENL
jgi:hypothetical protein